MLGLTVFQSSLAFLVLVTPICAWVVISDLRVMKIYNKAVLALIAIFALAGPLLLPLDTYLWRWLNLVVIFTIMVIYMMLRDYGAGDLKFFSATALFYDPAHASLALFLLALCIVVVTLGIVILRRLPGVEARLGHWKTFRPGMKKIPMGLGFAFSLWIYLALLAWYSAPVG